MEKINFKAQKYDTDLILGVFNLKHGVKDCAYLQKLLNATGNMTEQEEAYLERHRLRLELEGNFWNEEELKMHFAR